jgi:hypothetical protein
VSFDGFFQRLNAAFRFVKLHDVVMCYASTHWARSSKKETTSQTQFINALGCKPVAAQTNFPAAPTKTGQIARAFRPLMPKA